MSGTLSYRPMTLDDIGAVPLDCQGSVPALRARIRNLGSAAILAFDGDQHVAQLQFRRHDPALISKNGIWESNYWGAFGDVPVDIPPNSLGVFCFHVGQLAAGEERDSRYFGRGIAAALLDQLIDWATQKRFDALVAKHTPSDRAVMAFMGGLPETVYASRGFQRVASWTDPQLREAVVGRKIAPETAAAAEICQVGMCVKRLS